MSQRKIGIVVNNQNPTAKIGIVVNNQNPTAKTYTDCVTDWLVEQRYLPVFEEEEVYKCPLIIVLGGDGTVLKVAHKAALFAIPMLGINLGHLGYLTDVDKTDGLKAIEKVLSGNFREEQRMMLEARGHLALNEIFISRGGQFKIMEFSVMADGYYMDTLRADGIIVSTPTGSTAYNLSAGGPILRPDAEMIVVNTVCPHALHTRPWVLSGNDKIQLTLTDSRGGEALVSIDGEIKFKLNTGESVYISRSKYYATVIKTAETSFFEVLRDKMRK
ncbi:MAG: NAD(+)/NADH kinase [Turicibacter sp.]|nr:NAD(+)/NADH kinase [Turicibacter sp.]